MILHPDPTNTYYIAELILHRPAKLNAMSGLMFDEVRQGSTWVATQPAVRVLIIRGEGRAFSAGLDLTEAMGIAGGEESQASRLALWHRVRHLQACFDAIAAVPQPTIVALHGISYGGAIDLAVAADMRFASADVALSVKEVDLGIVADLGTLARLPKIVGPAVAADLALSGRVVGADFALRTGLVTRVFETVADLHAGTLEAARSLAALSPLTVQGTKRVLAAVQDQPIQVGLDLVAAWNSAFLVGPDLQEALSAKAERRQAVFRNSKL
jgi:enoyl-CoA hydratase